MLIIDKPSWAPVAYVRQSGVSDDEDLTDGLSQLQYELEQDRLQRRKVVAIIDLRGASPLNAPQRRIVAQWMSQNEHRMALVSLGVAFVIESRLARGTLTALLWVSRLPVPHEVASNLDDAVRWTIQRLELRDLPVPERLRSELGNAFEKSTVR